MRYSTIEELPIVCQLNLPEAALHVYKDAYNHAWQNAAESEPRERLALNHAWDAVRDRFERDLLTGRWVPKAAPMQPRVATLTPETEPTLERSAS